MKKEKVYQAVSILANELEKANLSDLETLLFIDGALCETIVGIKGCLRGLLSSLPSEAVTSKDNLENEAPPNFIDILTAQINILGCYSAQVIDLKELEEIEKNEVLN